MWALFINHYRTESSLRKENKRLKQINEDLEKELNDLKKKYDIEELVDVDVEKPLLGKSYSIDDKLFSI